MDFAPPPFSLRQLQYAVAVAETLSFGKAAKRCAVSQPSLSAQLAQLESVLGTRLFERESKRVLVTPSGAALIERARKLLVEAEDLSSAAKVAADPLMGTLRIGVIPTLSPYLLPAMAKGLRRTFPELTVLWVEEKTQVLMARLESGALDAALVALEADLPEVEREVLAVDPFWLATPRGHPLGQKAGPASTRELREEDVLLLDEGHCFREQALAICSRARAHELEFRATSLPTLVQMVAGGAGVTLLPELAIATELPRSELSLRPFAEPAPHRTVALVWRVRSPLGPALRKLSGTLRSAYPIRRTARG